MATFHFDEQLAAGEDGERFLDQYFSARFIIVPATEDEQRQGIDRHFTNRESGSTFTIEYKTDWRAYETGNAFVETVSVDTRDKPGWAVNCNAFRLLYFTPQADIVYVLRTETIRKRLAYWQRSYPVRSVQNDGYRTWGLLVPLRELERWAEKVEEIK